MMKNMIAKTMIACVAILMAVCAPTMAATLFSDNFDSGSLAAWGQQYPSDWSATGGAAVCNEAAGAYSRAWHDEVLLTSNWSYDVDLKWTQSNMANNPDFGSFGAYLITNPSPYGAWWIHAQQWNGVVKIINNGDTYEESTTTTSSATGDYHLNIARIGTANNLVITLTGGGAPLTLTTANAPGLGNYSYVGLLNNYGKVAFDNVLVSSPPVAPPTVPEPASLCALALGLLGFGGLRLRRTR
ncbi:MAG: PEP-CTERM sorting domain-containing protein [Armatimonadota bacterium]